LITPARFGVSSRLLEFDGEMIAVELHHLSSFFILPLFPAVPSMGERS